MSKNPPTAGVPVNKTAGFSRCGHYRYWLKRCWDDSQPHCTFIGLNPSTADAKVDDPTIRRIMGFARSWGYGSVTVVNLFAYRTPYPDALKQAADPVGPRNNHWIRKTCADGALVVAAWGNDGSYLARYRWLQSRISPLHCLGMTKAGQPRHPLYVPKHTDPAPLSCQSN